MNAELFTWEDLSHELADVTWAWQSWIPNGYVTMLAADPGVGKSMFALSVADKFIRGGAWFNGIGSHEAHQDDMVLWVECEAGEPFHIARANKLGLDTGRVMTMRLHTEEQSTPSLTSLRDRERLSAILRREDVKLCIVDSLSGAISGVDENTAEVGKVVQWLSEQARDSRKPVLLIHHMNKSAMRTRNADQPPSMADLRGSSAIPQHCRVIMALDMPYGDASKLRLTAMKNNLAPKPNPVSLLIHPDGYIIGSGEIQPARDFTGAFGF